MPDKTIEERRAANKARIARTRAAILVRGEEVVGEARSAYAGQWVRTTRVVIFEGPADSVFAQIGRSHAAPSQRNVGAKSGCQITFVQGPLEVIDPADLTDFGHEGGDFYDGEA